MTHLSHERSEEEATAFLAAFKARTDGHAPLFTSDKLPAYVAALIANYSTPEPPPAQRGRGRPRQTPRRVLDTALLYAQVDKRREQGRVVEVRRRIIFAARDNRNDIAQLNFESAMERVVAGLQQRRVVTEKEKRILAYHEAGHAVMAYLMGEPVQKATIVARGDALGYTFHLPDEDRYLHTREELIDWMKTGLAGRAAEQVVFDRVTNGAANDLEKVTTLARAMVFEYGMSEEVASRTMRADNYALSEETKRLRDKEQARLTDGAYAEAIRLLEKHRSALDRVAGALLDRETLNRADLEALLHDVAPESRASETVGTIRVLPQLDA